MIMAFFVFVIGACVGSFCSALLYRTRSGESVVTGRSHCVACLKVLGPVDLIPIVSWLIRRGRCRHCGARFSWQYLALEAFFGAMFVAVFWRFCGWGDACYLGANIFSAISAAVFLVFLALIFVYDGRYGEIPDSYSLTGAAAGLVLNVFAHPQDWLWYVLAMAVGAAFFGVQFAVSRGKWVGDGDILVGLMIGAMVGWPNVLAAIFLAYGLGLALVVALLLAGRKKMTDTIPLGPLLAAGTAIVIFLNPVFLQTFWYAFS